MDNNQKKRAIDEIYSELGEEIIPYLEGRSSVFFILSVAEPEDFLKMESALTKVRMPDSHQALEEFVKNNSSKINIQTALLYLLDNINELRRSPEFEEKRRIRVESGIQNLDLGAYEKKLRRLIDKYFASNEDKEADYYIIGDDFNPKRVSYKETVLGKKRRDEERRVIFDKEEKEYVNELINTFFKDNGIKSDVTGISEIYQPSHFLNVIPDDKAFQIYQFKLSQLTHVPNSDITADLLYDQKFLQVADPHEFYGHVHILLLNRLVELSYTLRDKDLSKNELERRIKKALDEFALIKRASDRMHDYFEKNNRIMEKEVGVDFKKSFAIEEKTFDNFIFSNEENIPFMLERFPELFTADKIAQFAALTPKYKGVLLKHGYLNGYVTVDDLKEIYADDEAGFKNLGEDIKQTMMLDENGDLTFRNYEKVWRFLDEQEQEMIINDAIVYASNKEEGKSTYNQLRDMVKKGFISLDRLKKEFLSDTIPLEVIERLSKDEELKDSELDLASLCFNSENLVESFKILNAKQISKILEQDELDPLEIPKDIDIEQIKLQYDYQKKILSNSKDNKESRIVAVSKYLNNKDKDSIALIPWVIEKLYGEGIFDFETLQEYDDLAKKVQDRLSYKLYNNLLKKENKEQLSEDAICLRPEDRGKALKLQASALHDIDLSVESIDNPIILELLRRDKKIETSDVLDLYVQGHISKNVFNQYLNATLVGDKLPNGMFFSKLFKFDGKAGKIKDLYSEAIPAIRATDDRKLKEFRRFYEFFERYGDDESKREFQELQTKEFVEKSMKFKTQDIVTMYKNGLISGSSIDALLTLTETNKSAKTKSDNTIEAVSSMIIDDAFGIKATDLEKIFRDTDNHHKKRDRLERIIKSADLDEDQIMTILTSIYSNEEVNGEINQIDLENYQYLVDKYIKAPGVEIVDTSDSGHTPRLGPKPEPNPEPKEDKGIPYLKRLAFLRKRTGDEACTIQTMGNTLMITSPKYNKVLFEMIYRQTAKKEQHRNDTQHATYIFGMDDFERFVRPSIFTRDDITGKVNVVWETNNGGIRAFKDERYCQRVSHNHGTWERIILDSLENDSDTTPAKADKPKPQKTRDGK